MKELQVAYNSLVRLKKATADEEETDPIKSRLELQIAYNSFLRLKRTIVYEESDEETDPNEPASELAFKQHIDMMLSTLASKLDMPQSPSFSSMTIENLAKLKITGSGLLLKPNFKERIATTTPLGQNEFWSSANLYRQLHLLERTISRPSQALVHGLTRFFFRVSAMLPPDKRMIFNMEPVVPATIVNPSSLSTLSGLVDYTAVVASPRVANIFLTYPLHTVKTYMQSGFFVVEAKTLDPSDHVPEAVCNIYACGKLLQKKVLRGALTNGRDWIFLLIRLNEDYDGASYQQSSTIQLATAKSLDSQLVISEPWPDLIASILSHWTENGFTYLGSDDWFELA